MRRRPGPGPACVHGPAGPPVLPCSGTTRPSGGSGYAVTGAPDLGDAAPDRDAARGGRGRGARRRAGAGAPAAPGPRRRRPRASTGPWAGDVPEADGLVVTAPRHRGRGARGRLHAAAARRRRARPRRRRPRRAGAACRPTSSGSPSRSSRAAGAARLLARLGPTVCGSCYEVPEAMRDEVAALVPAAAGTTRDGTPSVDIPAGVRVQLAAAASAAGVEVEIDDSWCRAPSRTPTAFSHRRDAPTGRHAGARRGAAVSRRPGHGRRRPRARPRAGARRAELVQSLGRVRARVADACAAAGRPTSGVTLVVVTKTYPVDRPRRARLARRPRRRRGPRAGAARQARPARPGARARRGVGGAAAALARGRPAPAQQGPLGRAAWPTSCTPSTTPASSSRSPAAPRTPGAPSAASPRSASTATPTAAACRCDDLPALCDAVAAQDALRLLGVMAVAPLGRRPRRGLRPAGRGGGPASPPRTPGADAVSAGMSGDLEQAVAHGATHLRVGAAVLGARTPTG